MYNIDAVAKILRKASIKNTNLFQNSKKTEVISRNLVPRIG